MGGPVGPYPSGPGRDSPRRRPGKDRPTSADNGKVNTADETPQPGSGPLPSSYGCGAVRPIGPPIPSDPIRIRQEAGPLPEVSP